LTPYYQDDAVTIYHGDCREILPQIGQVDCVITDPPYQSLDANVLAGTTTRLVPRNGKRLSATDEGWFATMDRDAILAVLVECRKILRPDGAVYVFADVKSGLELFPGWARNVLVWDKCSIGMGYSWRRMHEWIAYEPMPDHVLRDKGLGDIIRVPVPSDKVHPTEKPEAVIAPLIRNSTDVDDVILDPFGGSGTTAVAAKRLGRRCILIEREEKYCEVAAKRLAQGALDLFGEQTA
jgi:site-specific DNA-methyltransferase (adenine-specific)